MLSLITISVGMDEMLNCWASSVSASVSTLPNTASACFSDARSKTGANMRHGPHQDAQKSTRTMSEPPTTDSKFWPVSSTVAMECLLVSTGYPLPEYPLGYVNRAYPDHIPRRGRPVLSGRSSQLRPPGFPPPPPPPPPAAGGGGAGGASAAGVAVRFAEERLADRDMHVVLAGDFDAAPDSAPHRWYLPDGH